MYLYIYLAQRYGYAPLKGEDKAAELVSLQADFSSRVPVDLYWDDSFWGTMGGTTQDQVHRVNTYPGHKWVVRQRGSDKVLQTWVIEDNSAYELDATGGISFVYEG